MMLKRAMVRSFFSSMSFIPLSVPEIARVPWMPEICSSLCLLEASFTASALPPSMNIDSTSKKTRLLRDVSSL